MAQQSILERGAQRGRVPYRQDETRADEPPDEPPVQEDELDGRHPAEEAPEEPPQEPETPTPPAEPPPTPSYRYASQQEAERAEEESKRRMHEATQEAAELRRHTLEIERELAELRAKQAAPVQAPAPETQRRPGESMKAYLQRMRTLDPNSESYDDEIAGLWGEALAAELQTMTQGRITPEEARKLAQEEFNRLYDERETVRRQQEDTRTQEQRIYDAAMARAKQEHGLDLDPQVNPDLHAFFWQVAAPAADRELGTDSPLERLVDFAIERTKKIAGGTVATPPADPTPPPEPTRRPSQPMGRGSSVAPAGSGNGEEAPPRPRSLNDITENIRQKSRV